MSVVGVAVILGLVIVLMLKLRVARASAVIVCILFGLVLGASPVGDLVYSTVSKVGAWAAGMVESL
ncbi:hypothetical protein FHX74_001635 [Friedmanniella endophytica]|uniref:Uncharacterized protein n=1 Tax=Microlunatus kandeliicorticis TaxID=1759536 RepID=A0A7W3IRU0_9ACTN|nr:hypothetical protein [Microlunatus kandeliicorticis]MBA8794030.1 hypothetical protein [Microlunatus kandeliicorticis]